MFKLLGFIIGAAVDKIFEFLINVVLALALLGVLLYAFVSCTS